MGSFQAREMTQTDLPLRVQIEWHLRSNHFPPVSLVFVDTAIEAINRARAGDWDAFLTMPNGLRRRAWQIVDGLHLESWVEEGEHEDE